MRLTKYEPNETSMFPYKLKDDELFTELDSIHKLGKLEDIEEELGIDLITLFKALENGVYFKVIPPNPINEPIEWDKGFIDLQMKEIRTKTYYSYPDYINGSYTLLFKDYGKTWALTKDEIPNDN